MKRLTDRYKSLLKNLKNKFKFSEHTVVFSFFLLVSTILWLLLALDKNYTTEISFPVKYVNFPKNKVQQNNLPQKFKLKIYGNGYMLLNYKIGHNLTPITVDVASLPFKQSAKDSSVFFVESQYLIKEIATQLQKEAELRDINPDTIFFRFSDVITKKIKVSLNAHIEPARQYMINGRIEIEPEYVTVTGTASDLDTIDSVNTQYFELTDLMADVDMTVDLIHSDKQRLEPEWVNIHIPVVQYTEADMKIPIKYINLPDTIELLTFPAQVTVSFHVGLDNYKKIKPEMFKAIVDYKKIISQKREMANVKLIKCPEYVKHCKINPDIVDYIIKKK